MDIQREPRNAARQPNVLHQSASCFSRYGIRDIVIQYTILFYFGETNSSPIVYPGQTKNGVIKTSKPRISCASGTAATVSFANRPEHRSGQLRTGSRRVNSQVTVNFPPWKPRVAPMQPPYGFGLPDTDPAPEV
ncbi:hypothetical protein T265_07033 [Opisthorchis viverrini]|uniref:Uncharacterized protein n=1 Tax=Opisthorchis viverrini TaxID=6198 RepID=A0A074ZE12_OPIVI|nr:hypothetical protein T265_07033 [Opisthorchis viverrini]KER25516.1 hypothetical protein T265_07033 [Opisthorchis viverrini]